MQVGIDAVYKITEESNWPRMAPTKAEEKPQETKKEDGKPLANGVKKEEAEELVICRANGGSQ